MRRRASITRRGRRRSEGGGVRFTVSSAARRLTNYLWNCCIHSHLNRNLSGGERSAPRSEQRGGSSRPARLVNHILRRGPSALLLPCSISLSDHPPTPPPLAQSPPLQASPFSRGDGLSLMQIYNHFICRCLPRTACRNIAQHHASKMSSLTQAPSLASSQSPGLTHPQPNGD